MVAPGALVGSRHVIEGLLGRGGMADVYLARDVLSGRRVAVKALRSGAADARRFEVETRLLARFEHPNLVRLLDAGWLGELPYLVMELVEGPTLAVRLEQGPLDPIEARRIGCDIARGLAHVHAQGVIHRDVKPSNILLAPDGRALLGDFGAARVTDGVRLTGARATIGNAAFLAPEQIGGSGVTSAVDVYALGLVLVEAMSGQRVFPESHHETLAARMARDPRIPPGLPAPWPGLLRAMTNRNPALRPGARTVAARLAAPPPPDPALDTVAMDMVVEIERTDTFADTERAAAVVPTRVRPRRAGVAAGATPMVWLLGALFVVALLAAIAVAPDGGGGGGRDPAGQAGGAITPMVSTTATTAPSATVTSTSATGSTAGPVSTPIAPSAEPQVTPAATCADLEAHRQAIEAAKQQVDETYRNAPETREQLKRQLEDEKQALDAQKQSLGC